MRSPEPPASNGFSPQVLDKAPEELRAGRLRRLGEGVGKVVYASPHWVVKRVRSPKEILALILVWKLIRKMEGVFPPLRRRLAHPSRQIRLLRVAMQGLVSVIPHGWWYTSHAAALLRQYRAQTRQGERLAEKLLTGTDVVPRTVEFPPVRVAVAGWPGWLTVEEATERVEANLHDHLWRLARADRFEDVELWLNRFLDLRLSGWARGVFSVDAHLKNYGVIGDRVVLLDAGGLTNRWPEIERRLTNQGVETSPHLDLGLGSLLSNHSGIAERFNERWKSTVNPETVRLQWPG